MKSVNWFQRRCCCRNDFLQFPGIGQEQARVGIQEFYRLSMEQGAPREPATPKWVNLHEYLCETGAEQREKLKGWLSSSQEELDKLGGWTLDGLSEVPSPCTPALQHLGGREIFEIRVLDNVVPESWCRNWIEKHEKIGSQVNGKLTKKVSFFS